MYMKKHRRNLWQIKFWKRVRAICNLHSCYNFALMLHDKVLVFSQSEGRNYFMYIINLHIFP